VSARADILIVDDDRNTLASLARAFRLAGHAATVCDNAARALDLAKAQRFDLILSDVVMPGRDGLALLEDFKKAGVGSPIVMISGQGTIEVAVRATRLGAIDFLEKPISIDKLLLTVENALRLARLEEENRDLKRRLGRHQMVWTSPAMLELMAQVERVASSETRVCIRGETGTGKEMIARTLHEKSARHSGSFVSLNCAAVPAELIESELFGHEKGSFTGAATRHVGRFEQAHHGTLFLDEIGDMPLPMQAKLLRVLEEGEIERVGGDKPIPVDVRVIVATHRNLEEQVQQGTFREDLYHRIFVFPILLPPLRERRDDIPVLAEHFSQQLAEQNGWRPRTFSAEALEALAAYAWPGNVRELRNVIERILLLSGGDVVEAAAVQRALPPSLQLGSAGANGSAALLTSGTMTNRIEAFERETLLRELKRNHHHVTNTAKALGMERSHVYKKCKELGIDLQAMRHTE
jgi:two-component system, NtrC family, nitrogen regulation response regulator NtrX